MQNLIQATVVILWDTVNDLYCLARKKQAIHHEGNEIAYSLGVYNGYGGKRDPEDKTILETALRELSDEASVTGNSENLSLVARAYFYTKTGEQTFGLFMDVSFFLLAIWTNDPKEGDEMGPPVWFKKEEFPYSEMMPADKFLFEQIFAGNRGVYAIKLKGKNVAPEIEVLDEKL